MIPNCRIWDIKNKYYLEDMSGYDLYFQDGKIYEQYEYSYCYQICTEFKDVTDQYIVEMGSGVFNNGTEIFEGDLVNVRDSLGQIRVAEVKFRDGYFYTTCIVRYRWGESPCENQLKSYSKVVGHIHE